MISGLPEHSRSTIDATTLVSAGVSGAVAAITLNEIAVVLTILSLLLNIGWMLLKYLYLRKNGADALWGGGNGA